MPSLNDFLLPLNDFLPSLNDFMLPLNDSTPFLNAFSLSVNRSACLVNVCYQCDSLSQIISHKERLKSG